MRAILDTTFLGDFSEGIEETWKKKDDLKNRGIEMVTTVLNQQEFLQRTPIRRSEKKYQEARAFLNQFIMVPYTSEDVFLFSEIQREMEREGRTVGTTDIMIGAIARNHGAIVVTRNVKDFLRIPGVKVESY